MLTSIPAGNSFVLTEKMHQALAAVYDQMNKIEQ